MKDKMRLFCCLLASLCLTGCASIVSKSNYPVTINSAPSGADVTVSDSRKGTELFSGKTPTTVTLKSDAGFFKSAKYDVVVRMAGYDTARTQITASIDGWYIGNLLFGGLIGFLIVDPATGAMYKLDDAVTVNLVSESTTGNFDAPQLRIVTVDELPSELQDQLVRIQ